MALYLEKIKERAPAPFYSNLTQTTFTYQRSLADYSSITPDLHWCKVSPELNPSFKGLFEKRFIKKKPCHCFHITTMEQEEHLGKVLPGSYRTHVVTREKILLIGLINCQCFNLSDPLLFYKKETKVRELTFTYQTCFFPFNKGKST